MNLYRMLKGILPDPQLQVGTVTAVSNGVATVEVPGGGQLKARGSATVGTRVFVRDGVIEGTAPSLSTIYIEV